MISENKIKHSLAVARKCYELSSKVTSNEAERFNYFVMGYLHDIGYENGEALGHSLRGYEALLNFGCADNEYVKAIKNHGTPLSKEEITVPYLILVYSDLTTDYLGNSVTIEERLRSIKARYGGNSKQLQNAHEQVEILKSYEKEV